MRTSGAQGPYRADVAHGLMFHRFDRRGEASGWQGALSAEDFDDILQYVGVDRLLAAGDWAARAAVGELAPMDLCVTFDDGLRCQAECALPVLNKYGVKAFWFVYSCVFDGVPVKSEIYSYLAAQIGGLSALAEELIATCPPGLRAQLESSEFVSWAAALRKAAPFYSAADLQFRFLRNNPDNKDAFEDLTETLLAAHGLDVADASRQLWLTPADLAELARGGHWVGLHSYSHPYNIAALSHTQQLKEYARNQADLTRITGMRPLSMSHPLNSYSEESLEVLRELGVKIGFRANMLTPPARSALNPNALELAREDSTTLHQTIRIRGARNGRA